MCGLSFAVRLVGRLGWDGLTKGLVIISLRLGCLGCFIRIRIIAGVAPAASLCCCLALTIYNNYLSISLICCCSILRMILVMSLLRFEDFYVCTSFFKYSYLLYYKFKF